MDSIYKCRICDRMYHDKEVVIDLSSEEAKKEQIAAKILSALTIVITDHDPTPNYICRICYGQVEVNFRFATACRINNAKYIEKLTNIPSNDVLRTEYKKFMRLPVHALFNMYQFDVKGLFDAVTSYLNGSNEGLSSTLPFKNVDQNFGLTNNITNQYDIGNDNPVVNGIPEKSSVLETNEPNIDTNNIDNIHNSGIDLNNQSSTNRRIVNNNNIDHAFNTGRSRNITNFPVLTPNNLSQTINPGGIFRFVKNGPNVGTNNVNKRLAINNINQSRINRPLRPIRPIVCKNNVMKTSQFCIMNKTPPPLRSINNQINKAKTVQIHGSARHRNQSNVDIPPTVQNPLNHHNYSVQSKKNVRGEINYDEVICLDDDDDDNDAVHHNNDNNNNDNGNNNGNGNDSRNVLHFINPLNHWILEPMSCNTNNNAKSKIHRTYQRKNKNSTKEQISFKRKLVSLSNNVPSTHISTEEMTVTPDMPIPLSTSDAGSSLSQEEDIDFEVPHQVDNEPTEPLLVELGTDPLPVLPNTGFHFLFSTEETVDLTTKEDNTPKKKPTTRKKKTPKPKKPVAPKRQSRKTSIAQNNPESQLLRTSTSSTIEKKQTRKSSIAQNNLKTKSQFLRSSTSSTIEKLDTSLIKPRPKRASAIASTVEIKNSSLSKLGKHAEGYWSADTIRISLILFRCPICDVFLYSIESRQNHELSKHSSLLESLHKPGNSVTIPGNEICSEKLFLFNYLQLCLISKNKTKTINQLPKRTNMLKAFKTIGPNIIGYFKCYCCPYETNIMFALWAHLTSYHLYCEYEKKSCLFCFLCTRTLTKRTTMLKHLDSCVNKVHELTIDNNEKLICVICGNNFDSLIELDDHLWTHR